MAAQTYAMASAAETRIGSGSDTEDDIAQIDIAISGGLGSHAAGADPQDNYI